MGYFKRKKRISFKTISWTMLLGRSIFNRLVKQRKKVTILYGTETGQSKRFANQALKLFMFIYRCTLVPLDHENLYENIRSSDINIFISSTFGSGEAPTMAEAFRQELMRLVLRKIFQEKHHSYIFIGQVGERSQGRERV